MEVKESINAVTEDEKALVELCMCNREVTGA